MSELEETKTEKKGKEMPTRNSTPLTTQGTIISDVPSGARVSLEETLVSKQHTKQQMFVWVARESY